LAGGLWAWAFAEGNFTIFLSLAGLAMVLAPVAMTDLATQRLPLLPLLLVAGGGLLFNPLATASSQPAVAMALAGALWWGVGAFSTRLAGKPALGQGDIWLASVLGAWLGVWGLLPWLAAVAVLGLLTVLWRQLRCLLWRQGGGRGGRLAFAPLLIAAAWMALLHGHLYYAWVLGA